MTPEIPPVQPTPQPNNRRTLYIILGIVGGLVGLVCVCGVVGLFVLNSLGNRVETVFSEISTSIAVETAPTSDSLFGDSGGITVNGTPIAGNDLGEETPTADVVIAGEETPEITTEEETPTAEQDSTTGATAGMTEADGPDNTKIFTSNDGRSQVTAGNGWRIMDLHDDAELQIGGVLVEKYLIVLTETEEDSATYTLDDFASAVRDNFGTTLTNSTVSEPVSLTINGMPAIQYEIRGTSDTTDVAYWLTAVQGTTNFYQVIGWTLAEEADKNGPEIKQVINSFTVPN